MMVYDIGVNSSYRGFTKAVFAGLEVAVGGGDEGGFGRSFVVVIEGVKPGVNTSQVLPRETLSVLTRQKLVERRNEMQISLSLSPGKFLLQNTSL
jgi:hypothetical protein